MTTYVWNKIFSLGLPFVAIIAVYSFVKVPASWTMLLVGISLIGYTHYILGTYYQHQAWRKRKQYPRFLCFFTLLASISVMIVIIATTYHWLWLVALLTIPYFVWHGYENEHTLYTRSTGQQLSPWLLGGISVAAVGATLDAFRHTR